MKKALIWFAVIFFVVSVGTALFFWYQARTARGLTLELSAPDQILVGTPFEATVKVRNESRSVLKGAKLSLLLPQEVVAVGTDARKTVITRTLGDLGVESVSDETFTLLVTGGENTLQELKASVTYAPTAVGGQFKREETKTLAVSGSGLALDAVTPKKVFSGQEFETEVSFHNASGNDFSEVRLKAFYPPAFTVTGATPKADQGNAIWELGGIHAEGEGKIVIKGKLNGPDASFFDMKFELESNVLGDWYTVNTKSAPVTIEASPLSLEIDLNGDPNYVAKTNDDLRYTLRYTNTTNIGMRDVVIRAKLKGEMFNLSTVSAAASLRAADNTLVWNAANTPALALIAPGASGLVEFRIRVKPEYPIRRPSDKNFTVKVEAEIESPTVPEFVGADKTLTRVDLETKVGGRVLVDAQGFFRDAPAGIVNSGPYPPKVNQATQFTIHWLIVNYGTDVKNVEVRAFLGGNVRLVSVVKSNGGTSPAYNERTQELVWAIDRIPATRGVVDAPLEAVMQVELLPSIVQAGTAPTLIQETNLQAVDEFTGTTLTATDAPITTELKDDPTLVGGANRGAVGQ